MLGGGGAGLAIFPHNELTLGTGNSRCPAHARHGSHKRR